MAQLDFPVAQLYFATTQLNFVTTQLDFVMAKLDFATTQLDFVMADLDFPTTQLDFGMPRRVQATYASTCRDRWSGHDDESWPAKFGQPDKWKICLKAARMPRIGSDHGKTSTMDPCPGIYGL
jgi:hypothetical protein